MGPLLHDDCTLHYPWLGEWLCGHDNYIALTAEYLASGCWSFIVQRIVADEEDDVSEVAVTDGAIVARAISLFTSHEGRI